MTLFRPGENCWRVAHGDTCVVLVDAENYFRSVRSAMKDARERIILIGWDFDARVKMYDTQGDVEGPLELGEYLEWLVDRNAELHIHILQWSLGALKLLKRGRTLMTVAKWLQHDRIHVELDDNHPYGAAQHEKLIVIDRDTAFCGGIDITDDRWDTRAHRDREDRRAQPGGVDAGPWHDAASRVTGEIAQTLADHAEKRWADTTGDAPRPVSAVVRASDSGADEPITLRNVEIAVARTRGASDPAETVREIEMLYRDMIRAACDHIYIETQYLTSRTVVSAIAERLSAQTGPEVVMVMPATADGWLESQVMDTTRARLVEALRRIDHAGRFQVFHPVTSAGTDIYVHAKILIGDTRFFRVGSSNLSNRSMGFDSECDICIDAQVSDDPAQTQTAIAALRSDLIGEHLGCAPDEVTKSIAEKGSLIAVINAHVGSGRHLRPFEAPDLNVVQEWLSNNDILDDAGEDEGWPQITL